MAPKKRVTWASRHLPKPEQVAELTRLFGAIEIKLYKALHSDGSDIALRMYDWFCDELVLVGRNEIFCAMSRKGIMPLRPIGYYESQGGTIVRDEESFNFLGFQRVRKAELKVSPVCLPLKPNTTQILFCGLAKYKEHLDWLRKKFGGNVRIFCEPSVSQFPITAKKFHHTTCALPHTVSLSSIASLRHKLPECAFLIGQLDEPRSRRPLLVDARGTSHSFVGFKQIDEATWISEKL